MDVRTPRGGAQLLVDTSRLPYLDGGLDDDEAAKDVWPRQFPLLLPGASGVAVVVARGAGAIRPHNEKRGVATRHRRWPQQRRRCHRCRRSECPPSSISPRVSDLRPTRPAH